MSYFRYRGRFGQEKGRASFCSEAAYRKIETFEGVFKPDGNCHLRSLELTGFSVRNLVEVSRLDGKTVAMISQVFNNMKIIHF